MHSQPRHLAYLKLSWISVISMCVLIFLVSGSLLNLFGPARDMGPALAFNLVMLVCGGLCGYYGMKQDALLNQVEKVRAVRVPEQISKEVISDEILDEGSKVETIPDFIEKAEISIIVEKLEQLMRNEKPYLDPKFSMQDLCERLDVKRRKVTFVINEVLNKNFYGVINDYRIEDAIAMLNEKALEEYKVDAIAEMVGFQSKSSFYACFKRYTGVTPSEYKLNDDV